MKKSIYIIIGVVIALGLGLIFGSGAISQINLGGVMPQTNTTWTNASSTPFSIGHQLSTTVLHTYGGRKGAIICNHNTGNQAYLVFGTTAVTATTTADTMLESNACFTIDSDNLYTGTVQVIQETATTTNSLLVVEFF